MRKPIFIDVLYVGQVFEDRRKFRQPPYDVMSTAPSVALKSPTNPFTHSPSSSSIDPIASGLSILLTNPPRFSVGIVQTSSSIAAPSDSLRTKAGRIPSGSAKNWYEGRVRVSRTSLPPRSLRSLFSGCPVIWAPHTARCISPLVVE